MPKKPVISKTAPATRQAPAVGKVTRKRPSAAAASAASGSGSSPSAQKERRSARDSIVLKKHSIVRDEIVAAATELFASRGYRAVTMEDIAAELGYTKSVAYYYFKNKNDVLWQIFRNCFDLYSAGIEGVRKENLPCREAFYKMVYVHAMNVMTARAGAAVYNREEGELAPQQRSLLSKMKRDYDAVFEAAFQRGISEGVFRDFPPHVAVSGIVGMCNWLIGWYNPLGPLSAEEIANSYASLLAGGYLAE